MRGRWALAAAAVLALVVVGGIGGLTMRAVAGVSHSTVVKTKTVTKLCVYIDHTHKGSSYGDVSTSPRYGNKICIAGKQGPAGDSSVITWNKTVATATSPQGAKRKVTGSLSGGTVLATVGPFTIRGYCTTGDGYINAATRVVSGQAGSSFTRGGTTDAGTFNSGASEQASESASSNDPAVADWANESDSGDFSVSTADNKTAFTGSANDGVYMNGADGPNCSFSGYVVLEK